MRKLLGVALPSALLAVLITAACDVGAPVSSEVLPNFLDAGTPGCPEGFKLTSKTGPVDRNKDGLICVKTVITNGVIRVVRIDNRGCPPGYIIAKAGQGDIGRDADRNNDGFVCTMTTGDVEFIVTLGTITVTVLPATHTFVVGATVDLTATITGGPPGAQVTWATRDPAVATVVVFDAVNNIGRVTAEGSGTTDIIATFGGAGGSATVTVN